MTTVTRAVDIEGLKVYQKQNPTKFKWKFGDLDLDNVEEGFDINYYKLMVVQERTKRDKYQLSQDEPITPDTFKPKEVAPVETKPVEPTVAPTAPVEDLTPVVPTEPTAPTEPTVELKDVKVEVEKKISKPKTK